MSTTTLSNYKKPPRRWDDSGELDVFEAARYFSDYNDKSALVAIDEEMASKERRQGYLRQGRASLDIPSLKHHHQQQQQQKQQQQQQQHYYKQFHQNYTISSLLEQQKQQIKEKKKYKQPSSPSGKLANFLNSLFNQTIITSKKKKQPKSTQSMKDEDEILSSGRRQRRSSISHFLDTKSLYSSSSSGFRTPPPYTPTKSCQNVNTVSDYKEVLANLSKYKTHENEYGNLKDGEIRATNFDWVDEKIKKKNGIVEKPKNYNNGNNNSNKTNSNNNSNIQEKKGETKKFDEQLDDGGESDASSDLFELQIDYEFGYCSSGLPVYETTHMDNIKRPSSTAISNGPIKN